MGKNKYLPEELRLKVVELKRQVVKQCSIARNLDLSEGFVSEILKKFQLLGNITNRSKSGRPRKTTLYVHKGIKTVSIADPYKSFVQMNADIRQYFNTDITARRCLCEVRLFGIFAVKNRFCLKRIEKKSETFKLDT
ncbi:unnamed protein product [Acanthoscelides obtectus]|uniref:Paired domain-containing protein n=1 Tax=Acanthoscelides obtectus TaxID=200917 RepID=A0A9P0P902_ACAOB